MVDDDVAWGMLLAALLGLILVGFLVGDWIERRREKDQRRSDEAEDWSQFPLLIVLSGSLAVYLGLWHAGLQPAVGAGLLVAWFVIGIPLALRLRAHLLNTQIDPPPSNSLANRVGSPSLKEPQASPFQGSLGSSLRKKLTVGEREEVDRLELILADPHSSYEQRNQAADMLGTIAGRKLSLVGAIWHGLKGSGRSTNGKQP